MYQLATIVSWFVNLGTDYKPIFENWQWEIII